MNGTHRTQAIVVAAALGVVAGAVVLSESAGTAGRNPEVAALFEGGARALRVGPTPRGLVNVDAATCTLCHREIAAEWSGSMHRASWTNDVFQAAYQHEALAFCRNCHAPLHTSEVPRGVAASDGISCAVCHVRGGTILASGRGAFKDGSTRPTPHPVRVDARLGESGFCESCHDFGFLSSGGTRGRVETKELQQSTFTEWRTRYAGGETTEGCLDCHMPWTPNVGDPSAKHRSHTFAARRDPAALARAVKVQVTAKQVGERAHVSAELLPGAVGHAFPTGDLFRRLELTVWPEALPLQTARITYERKFSERKSVAGTGTERYETSDTRVGEGAEAVRVVDLVMPERGPNVAGPVRVGWRLEYLLMSRELARRHKIDPKENVTVLGEGVVVVTP